MIIRDKSPLRGIHGRNSMNPTGTYRTRPRPVRPKAKDYAPGPAKALVQSRQLITPSTYRIYKKKKKIKYVNGKKWVWNRQPTHGHSASSRGHGRMDRSIPLTLGVRSGVLKPFSTSFSLPLVPILSRSLDRNQPPTLTASL